MAEEDPIVAKRVNAEFKGVKDVRRRNQCLFAIVCLITAYFCHSYFRDTISDLSKEKQELIQKNISLEKELTQFRTVAILPSDLKGAEKETVTPQVDERIRALVQSYYKIAVENPKVAFEQIAQITPAAYRKRVRMEVTAQLVSKNFAGAAQVFRFLEDPGEVAEILAATIPAIASENPKATLEIINQHFTGTAKNDALRQVLRYLSDSGKTNEAAEYLLYMPKSESRKHDITNMAIRLAKEDLNTAFRWIERLESEEEKRRSFLGIQQVAIEKKDLAALEYLLSVTKAPAARAGLLESLAKQIPAGSPQMAQFLESLPDREKDVANYSIIVRDNDTSSLEKLQRASSLNTQSMRSAVFDTVIGSKVRADPLQAANFVSALPDDLQPQALNALTVSWLRLDSGAAVQWISSLPSGSRRDDVLAVAVYALRFSDKSLARNAANLISSPASKEIVLKSIGK